MKPALEPLEVAGRQQETEEPTNLTVCIKDMDPIFSLALKGNSQSLIQEHTLTTTLGNKKTSSSQANKNIFFLTVKELAKGSPCSFVLPTRRTRASDLLLYWPHSKG